MAKAGKNCQLTESLNQQRYKTKIAKRNEKQTINKLTAVKKPPELKNLEKSNQQEKQKETKLKRQYRIT